MEECDPCQHCQYYSEFYDSSTGYTECDCSSDDPFAVCEIKPCPYFKPIYASEGLFRQLEEEDLERFYLGLD